MNRRASLIVIWGIAVSVMLFCLSCCSGNKQCLRGKISIKNENDKQLSLFGRRVLLVNAKVSDDLKKQFPWWNPDLFSQMNKVNEDPGNREKPWILRAQARPEDKKEADEKLKKLTTRPDELIVISFLADYNIENVINVRDWCKFWIDSYRESAKNNREEADFYFLVTRFLQESEELLNIAIERSNQLAQYHRMFHNYSYERTSKQVAGEYQKYAMSASIRAEKYQQSAQKYKQKADADKGWSTHFERLLMAIEANIDITNFLNLAQLDKTTSELLLNVISRSGKVKTVSDLQDWIVYMKNSLRSPFQSNITGETTIDKENSFAFRNIQPGSYFIIIPSFMNGNKKSFFVSRVEWRGEKEHHIYNSDYVYESRQWGILQQLLSSFFEDPVKKVAAGEPSPMVIDALLSKNPDFITFKDYTGRTALHYSLMKGRIDFAELLISKGADVNAKTDDGQTPLHFAVSRALSNMADSTALHMVESLISRGARVNEKDKEGITPLHKAVYSRNYLKLVEVLVKHGATMNEVDEDGETPLHYAVRGGHKEIVQFLIKSGADIEVKNNSGETAMDIAELYSRDSISRILQEEKNARDAARQVGEFFKAVETEEMQRVKTLLAQNPGLVNCQNNERDGETPLHTASAKGDMAIVKLLVSMGAKLQAKDKNGLTPLQYAEKADEKSVAEFLRGKGAR